MERFYRTIGKECLRTSSMVSIDDARMTLSEFIEIKENNILVTYSRILIILNILKIYYYGKI